MIITPEKLISGLGGTLLVAKFLNLKPPSVSDWKRNGIPRGRLIELAPIAEQKGVITRQQLFPNDYWRIWPELVNHPSAPQFPISHSEPA